MTEPSTPGSPAADPAPSADPVVRRRRQVAAWVKVAKRVGYSLLAVFCVLVAIGFPTGFPSPLTNAAIVAVFIASVLLAPAIVLGYAVKAADREDRTGDWR